MYEWEKGMNEISGFGGSYEDTCRKMLKAGLDYWDAHPKLDPQFTSYKYICGIISEDNEDAKALSKAVTDVGGDCTGAMHQAVISHILYVRKNGWKEYKKKMTPVDWRRASKAFKRAKGG